MASLLIFSVRLADGENVKKGNIWMGTRRKGKRHRNCLLVDLFLIFLAVTQDEKVKISIFSSVAGF